MNPLSEALEDAADKLERALVLLRRKQWCLRHDEGVSGLCPECYMPSSGYGDGLHQHDCELALLIDGPRKDPPK